ncbi:hypothetical protein J1605_021632 [Eschrichtius robustus]|uniref:Uncharacterized protein n=1 Tax=Eschrichtius robustus TaxID=9764 RepID=A0AB34HH92_ESCRO|nr:hypothetical protein J1605_021632 [Eschrichtius robustus]
MRRAAAAGERLGEPERAPPSFLQAQLPGGCGGGERADWRPGPPRRPAPRPAGHRPRPGPAPLRGRRSGPAAGWRVVPAGCARCGSPAAGRPRSEAMPDQISVSEFVAETHEDYKAPTASSFTTRTAQCRNTVAAIEEVSGAGGPRRAGGSGRR